MFSHLFSKFLSNFFAQSRLFLINKGNFAQIIRTKAYKGSWNAYSQRIPALHIRPQCESKQQHILLNIDNYTSV